MMFLLLCVHLYQVKGEHAAQVVVHGMPCTHQTQCHAAPQQGIRHFLGG